MARDSADVDSSGTYFVSVEAFEGQRQSRDQALLESLGELLHETEIAWASPPQPLAEGAESLVLGLRLQNAGIWSDVPLVARLLQNDDVGQLVRESAVQGALADCGFPAPRPVAVGRGRPGILAPFLVMERLAGRPQMSLQSLLIVVCVVLAVAGLGWLACVVVVAWYGLDVVVLHRLHAVPMDAFEARVAERGLDPAELRVPAWTERIAEKITAMELSGLQVGAVWLRDHAPGAQAHVVCHGDYWPGNVMVGRWRVTGLIDWANAAIAPREFDLGWSRVQDAGDLPPTRALPEPWQWALGSLIQRLLWIGNLPSRWLYRIGARLDRERLHYFTAFHCLRILVWSYERQRSADGAPNPWSSPRARALVARRFERATGVSLSRGDAPSRALS